MTGLDLFYSKIRSPSEFEFDRLTPSRTLFSMLPMELDNYLYGIAINPRNSVKKKYELIDRAMSDYGFSKLARGTNRSVYQSLFADDLIVKVGVDKYGVQDARREFYNQGKLKPFCTKTFEVSPTGAIGLFEKVKPIIYKDEFKSIAGDVFDLLTKHVLGKYILADIGASFYMNYGLRLGFGPVLLDYPYMYELDGTKIHCTNQIPVNGIQVKCDGLIDYDVTFDFLVCEKCGKKYLASDIAKINSDNTITINPDMIGECSKMAGRILINGEVAFDSTGKVSFAEKPEIARIIESLGDVDGFTSRKKVAPEPKQQGSGKTFTKPQQHNIDVYKNKETTSDYYNRQIQKIARDFLRRNLYDRHSLFCMVYGILSFIKFTDKSMTFDEELSEIANGYVEMILDEFERELPPVKTYQQKEVFRYNKPQQQQHNNNRRDNNGYRKNNNRPQQQQQSRSKAYAPSGSDTICADSSIRIRTVSEEPYGDVPNMYVGNVKQPIYDTQPIQGDIFTGEDEVIEPDYQEEFKEETEIAENFSTIGSENISRLQEVADEIDKINRNQAPQEESQKKNRRDIPQKEHFSKTKESF